jgi:hypothetical protein
MIGRDPARATVGWSLRRFGRFFSSGAQQMLLPGQ